MSVRPYATIRALLSVVARHAWALTVRGGVGGGTVGTVGTAPVPRPPPPPTTTAHSQCPTPTWFVHNVHTWSYTNTLTGKRDWSRLMHVLAVDPVVVAPHARDCLAGYAAGLRGGPA